MLQRKTFDKASESKGISLLQKDRKNYQKYEDSKARSPD